MSRFASQWRWGEFLKYGSFMTDVLDGMRKRTPPVPFMVVPFLLAGVAVVAPARRRLAVFYLLVGGLYALLGLGRASPLYDLYVHLPPGAATIRYAHRLFWVSGFCLAMLTALGLDAVWREDPSRIRRWLGIAWRRRWAPPCMPAPGRLRWAEAAAIAALVAAWRRGGAPDCAGGGVGAVGALVPISPPCRCATSANWFPGTIDGATPTR
jgi:hypothetical protein